MPLSIKEIEESLVQGARGMLRHPAIRVPSEFCSGLQTLLARHWDADPALEPRCFDGLELLSWRKRKSRRLWLRGLVDFLSRDGSACLLDVLEAELLLSPTEDRLDGYILRFGRRGSGPRHIPYEKRKDLLQELNRTRRWEWSHVFEKDRAQVS